MGGVYAALALTLQEDGRVVASQSQVAHSFIWNFMRCLYAGFTGGTPKQYNTGGSQVECLTGGRVYWTGGRYASEEGGLGITQVAGAGGTTGIVVGSSDAAFSVDHNSLGAQISHGTGTGNLVWGTNQFTGPTIAPDNQSISIRIARALGNSSSGDVTIREVGIIGRPLVTTIGKTAFDTAQILYARDVLESPITVGPEQQVTVDYVIKTVL